MSERQGCSQAPGHCSGAVMAPFPGSMAALPSTVPVPHPLCSYKLLGEAPKLLCPYNSCSDIVWAQPLPIVHVLGNQYWGSRGISEIKDEADGICPREWGSTTNLRHGFLITFLVISPFLMGRLCYAGIHADILWSLILDVPDSWTMRQVSVDYKFPGSQ